MYPGIHFQIFSTRKVLPKIFPLQVWAKIFLGVRIGRNFFKKGKVSGMKRLTEKEIAWLFEYVRSMENASQAARVAYGGTPISVRVKGCRKKAKLKPIIDKISDKWNDLTKDIDQIEHEVDAYLKRLKRRIRKSL